MQIFDGALDVALLLDQWYKKSADGKNGAFISFVGIVRDDDGISGLSFDIYMPILKKWYEAWVLAAKKHNCEVFFAHSLGDVMVGQSSYLAAVKSPNRKEALRLIDEFVEDFKASAPIWKYDLKGGERIYAKARSKPLKFAGLLK